MGAAGIIYLCRSKPEPAPGSPTIMSPNHGGHGGTSNGGYNALHEPFVTSPPSHVAIAVATPSAGHTTSG